MAHLLEGQRGTGHWPYFFAADWEDAGHHSMCMFHLAEAALFSPHSGDVDIADALERGARWLVDQALLPTKWGTRINWARNKTACLHFSSEYFFIAASLMRVAALGLGEEDEFCHAALELIRYVRTDLWNSPDPVREGPFRLTEAGIKIGYAWFRQSMGWVIHQLDDLVESIGWFDNVPDCPSADEHGVS